MLDRQVPTTYVRMLLQASDQDMVGLLEETGLSEEYLRSHDYLNLEQVSQTIRNLAKYEPEPDWGLRLGQVLGVSAHGSLGFAALSAPTLAEGLGVFERFIGIRAPYVDFSASENEGGRYLLQIHDRHNDSAVKVLTPKRGLALRPEP